MPTNSIEAERPSRDAEPSEEVENRAERTAEKPPDDNDESRQDKSLTDIDQRCSRTSAMKRLVEISELREASAQTDILKIRADLGLPSLENPPDTAAGIAKEVLAEQTKQELRELAQREREFLGAPEDGEGEPTGPEQGDAFVEQTLEVEDPAEAESKRQNSIEAWIKDQTAEAKKHFRNVFQESENGPRAEKLLELKMKRTLDELAADYIKTGKGGDQLYFVAKLKWAKLDGAEQHYISEVTVESGAGVKDEYPGIFGQKDGPLNAEEEGRVEKAKQEGTATEEEVK